LQCPICEAELLGYFDNWESCPICGSKFREARWKREDYINDYFKQREKSLRKRPWVIELFQDYMHYKVLLERFPDLPRGKKVIHALGGGFPKLESLLKPQKIVVYDFCAQEYLSLGEEIWETFRKYYEPPEIEYFEEVIPLDLAEDELATACHFLEHLKFSEIERILDTIRGELLIYQPNPERFISPNWFHNVSDHCTLLSPQAFAKLLEKHGFKILLLDRFSDDQLLLVSRD
jgi:hypothetical protein